MNENQRPIWIIVFAILLACIAVRAKGQEIASGAAVTDASASERSPESDLPDELTTMQLGDRVYVVRRASAGKHRASAGRHRASAGRHAGTPSHARPSSLTSSRPSHAIVSAQPAQFDSDSDPDGWLAIVMLLDADDQPVIRRATARFELIPRVPTQDFTGYVDANIKTRTWSVPLNFAADGVARVRLPLTTPLSPLVGWPATSQPAVGSMGGYYSRRRDIIRHATPFFASRTAVTDTRRLGGARNAIGLARFGELKMRVSVPSEGVFDAMAPVALRPSVLVDTRWPYQ